MFEILKIKRTFCIFNRLAFDRVGINHGCSDITVSQQFLNRSDIVIGLQKVTGETVAKGMGRGPLGDFSPAHAPFYGLLDMGVMEMIALVLFCLRDKGQGLCWKKPLPDQFLGGIFVFFLQ